MLLLKSLEVEGFGPFADRQRIAFPKGAGVTVIYGENMRGKTSLLNAIRYAFFGFVLGRGSRKRALLTTCNRERAAEGHYAFRVSLTFEYDGTEYELVRECRSRVRQPIEDSDFEQKRQLRKGSAVLGPQEGERLLHLMFPEEVSRFFLFDGELLQQYEELLFSSSEAGAEISRAIERILGVPLLKQGKKHLTFLAEEADKLAAKEASKSQATQALGNALQQATQQKEEHQRELLRLEERLKQLGRQRSEAEELLKSQARFVNLLDQFHLAEQRLTKAAAEETAARGELQTAMSQGWRSVLRNTVRAARTAAQNAAQADFERLTFALRRRAVDSGRCGVCEQSVVGPVADALRKSLPVSELSNALSPALTQLADLNRFSEADNSEQVRQIWQRLGSLKLEQVDLEQKKSDLRAAIDDTDAESLRRAQSEFHEAVEKMVVVKTGIDTTKENIAKLDSGIQQLKKQLAAHGKLNLSAVQDRATALQDAAQLFGEAVETYKRELSKRVEKRSTELFMTMTTEKRDYAGLLINDNYGLSIKHRDGRLEEARSAGAEHVVALALMGALQNNAPLRGPIVMDSPFGRLDGGHTDNVIGSLPAMAKQVILLVHEAEVKKSQVRSILGDKLVCEYELERVSARRTNVREVK